MDIIEFLMTAEIPVLLSILFVLMTLPVIRKSGEAYAKGEDWKPDMKQAILMLIGTAIFYVITVVLV